MRGKKLTIDEEPGFLSTSWVRAWFGNVGARHTYTVRVTILQAQCVFIAVYFFFLFYHSSSFFLFHHPHPQVFVCVCYIRAEINRLFIVQTLCICDRLSKLFLSGIHCFDGEGSRDTLAMSRHFVQQADRLLPRAVSMHDGWETHRCLKIYRDERISQQTRVYIDIFVCVCKAIHVWLTIFVLKYSAVFSCISWSTLSWWCELVAMKL